MPDNPKKRITGEEARQLALAIWGSDGNLTHIDANIPKPGMLQWRVDDAVDGRAHGLDYMGNTCCHDSCVELAAGNIVWQRLIVQKISLMGRREMMEYLREEERDAIEEGVYRVREILAFLMDGNRGYKDYSDKELRVVIYEFFSTTDLNWNIIHDQNLCADWPCPRHETERP